MHAWGLAFNPEDLDVIGLAVLRRATQDRGPKGAIYDVIDNDVRALIAEHQQGHERMAEAMTRAHHENNDAPE